MPIARSSESSSILAWPGGAGSRAVFIVFNGNPTGQNTDLGCELFEFDLRAGTRGR